MILAFKHYALDLQPIRVLVFSEFLRSPLFFIWVGNWVGNAFGRVYLCVCVCLSVCLSGLGSNF